MRDNDALGFYRLLSIWSMTGWIVLVLYLGWRGNKCSINLLADSDNKYKPSNVLSSFTHSLTRSFTQWLSIRVHADDDDCRDSG